MSATGRGNPKTGLAMASAVVALLFSSAASRSQDLAFQLDPSKTTVRFTLDAALHTVHGSFQAKPGTLRLDSSGQISGEILVDAKSGQTGNGMRDRKMHKEILESERYPEITFRPNRVNGAIAAQGKSSVMVHGTFEIHGFTTEITVPAQVERSGDSWTASVHFTIPYEKWGMKNPSTLFLRVSDSVEIDLVAAGSVVQ